MLSTYVDNIVSRVGPALSQRRRDNASVATTTGLSRAAPCVDQRGWLSADEFEDGVATTGLLPGPASTQLAIYCAWRLAGPAGAMVGGFCFIVPGLIISLALSSLFRAAHPPLWVDGAAPGAACRSGSLSRLARR